MSDVTTPTPPTPSTHESILSGIEAGILGRFNDFKKVFCCQATQERQEEAANSILTEVTSLVAAMQRRFPV